MRYLGIKSFEDIDRITIPEYEMRIKAYRYELVDHQKDLHLLAFLNQAVQATKKVGKSTKYIYTKFEDFFDYDAHIKNIEGTSDQVEEMDEHQKELLRLIKKANSANRKEE